MLTALLGACAADIQLREAEEEPLAVPCPEGLAHGVSTTSGCVVGAPTDGGEAFLGIPFAAPPVGELRFAPPVAVSPWSEPRTATEYGPICTQPDGLDPNLADAEQSEDCLTLNVWRPEGAEGLPVIVHVHGGGHTGGSGRFEFADHPALAEEAILVTVQYRLGAFGFFAQPALSAESADGASGNQGLRDNLLALSWLQDNAAAFGADPDQVLLWGFSAGGNAACAILESPQAAGLMSRVFVESARCGMFEMPIRSEGSFTLTAEAEGAAFAEAAGCTGTDAEQLSCMRGLSAEALLVAQSASDTTSFGIIRDGFVLPDHGLRLLEQGDFNRVPVVAGDVADEMRAEADATGITTAEELAAELRAQGPDWGIDDLDGLVARYPIETYGSASAALSQFMSDVQYVCPTRLVLDRTSDWVDAYGYWFTHLSNTSQTGAVSHGTDLPFWLGNSVYTDEEAALTQAMSGALVAFAAGAPAIDGIGAWPANGGMGGDDAWVELGDTRTVTTGVRREACEWLMENGVDL